MSKLYKIVETDNFNKDYPDERFVHLPIMTQDKARRIADVINTQLSGTDAPRFWQVVEDGYILQGGFEP